MLIVNGAQRQFAINLEAESQLCKEAWEAVGAILSGAVLDAPSLQRTLTAAFRNFILKSNPIPPPAPSPLGRAVTKERYVEILREQFGFNTEDEKEQFLADLLESSATIDSHRMLLGGKLLCRSGRIMWATFDLLPDGSVSGRDPFTQMATDANGIRAQLGLDPNEAHMDMLIFVYNLPHGIAAHFPTIAEAYAGDEWYWYFRPAGEFENWGYTMTWPLSALSPCPEIIHQAITADNITDKVRLVKGV